MGLVATWLNGIGLNSAVPTFEAAGIVSPAHLADLDVSYFESLGVTDPDDRRKLFYLVQRIKLAVNNKKGSKNESPTAVDRVDAVISESFGAEDENDAKQKKPKGAKHKFLEEKKVETEPARRSKRIVAKKKKTKKTDSKETNDSVPSSPTVTKKKSSGPPTKRDANVRRKTSAVIETSPPSSPHKRGASKKEKVNAKRNSNAQRKSLGVIEISPPSTPRSPSKKEKVKKPSSSPQKRGSSVVKERKVPKSPSSSPHKRGSPVVKERKVPKSPSSSPHKRGSPVVKERKVPKSPSRKAPSRTYSASNKSSIPSMLHRTSFSGEICYSPSKRNPESKLPVSTRSLYSEKPSGTIQSQTSSSESSSSRSIEITDDCKPLEYDVSNLRPRSDGSNLKARPDVSNLKSRRATLGNFDALGNTYQSSRKKNQADDVSESTRASVNSNAGTETSSKRGGSGNIPRATTTSRSSKSMGVSESALLQQYQRNKTKRSSMLPTTNVRESATTTAPKRSQSIPSPSADVFIQGASAPESWETKIGHIREDNEEEHELFRDELVDESEHHEYYDMRIKVIVRKRPMSNSERAAGGIDIIHPLDYGDYGKTLVYQPKTRVDLTKEVETVPFAFDNVFDESSTNIGIYNRSLRNLVEPFFEGQWATVFAYGQTGSGKTYTMMGSNITGLNAGTATMDESNLGLYYLAALDIFEMLKLPEYSDLSVRVSLFEIYGGKLFDLLNDRSQIKCLEDRKGKVCFPGLTEHPVHVPEHIMHFIEEGSKSRSTGTTSKNADSSRSHAVLQIKLVKNAGRHKNVEHGRFSFIDLAGNERGADTNNATKATRLEGAEINTSLLALKEVIRALATGGSMTHIPFRGSKLTQVLKDSFVGKKSRCCMVACISPDIQNCEQTLNTLKYADRVKERNPETGDLPKSCEQPTKRSSLQPLVKVSSSISNQRGSVNDSRNYLDDISLEEDELSDSFRHVVQNESLPHGPTLTEKQKAGQGLVASHRSVMTQWLAMVKDEMEMVNLIDANRENMDEYILQLQEVQRAQIGFLSELRGSLQKYVSAAEGPHQIEDLDESFEDLRDDLIDEY